MILHKQLIKTGFFVVSNENDATQHHDRLQTLIPFARSVFIRLVAHPWPPTQV
jgi:hypothetical protein